MNVLRYLRDIPVILRKVVHMSLNLDNLNAAIANLSGAAALELTGVAQLKSDLDAAKAALAKAQSDAAAADAAAQASIDELTAKLTALTAQFQPAQ